ncbi:MAG: TrmH family RNA methyltransferase, partial [Anaerolineae bacterium]
MKLARSLHRRRGREKERLFIVEGVRLCEEVLRAGITPALLFYTPEVAAEGRGMRLLQALADLGKRGMAVSEEVMRAISDTQTPQGVLAVVSILPKPPEEGLLLIVDRLRDPGNLGTILRSAWAAGVGQVVATKGTVDIYSPKVVRGAMGAHFHLSLAPDKRWKEIEPLLEERQILLAEAKGEVAYHEVDWSLPSALIIGGEAEGASEEAKRLAHKRVYIPMPGEAESLNAAVAASV